MKITFLYHSAFLLELPSRILLFDWYKGKLPPLPQEKPLYIFASHVHGDHYAPSVFGLRRENVQYVLGEGIVPPAPYAGAENVHVMRGGESITVDGMTISALPSTDEGVAFLLEADGRTIYHAGDLHWWHWPPENAEDEVWNENMARDFKAFTAPLKGKKIDTAFLPLDARLEDAFAYGFDYMMRLADIRRAFPMHCWGQFELAAKLKEMPCSESYRDRITEIQYNGQIFTGT